MDKIIITLARQYGSGGLKVGKRLAEELGINCYDSEMFRLVSNNNAMHDDLVAHDSRIKGTSLFDVASHHLDASLPDSESAEAADEIVLHNIYDYQSDIIRELAERESCVIVGRCSNYILKDRKDVVSVFVHAPEDFRVKRASSIHYMPENELRSYIRKIDEKKELYYRDYTGESWYDVSGYDLSLDSSKLGISGCVDRIKDYIGIIQK